MGLPDFLIIGAAKAGTSYLWELASRHPGIEPARSPEGKRRKELKFFDTHNYKRGLRWYRQWFADEPGLTMDATPYYLFCPRVPRRVAETLPNAKLIALLRDPASRAFSEYRHRVRHGPETLSFEDALKAEPQRIAGERGRMEEDEDYYSRSLRVYSYYSRGEYASQLARWQQYFPPEQMLVLDSGRLFANPAEVGSEVFDFLGAPLDPAKIEIPPKGFENAGDSEKMSRLTKFKLRRAYRGQDRELREMLGVF